MDPLQSQPLASAAPHTLYTVPLAMYYAMGASVCLSFAGSTLVHGKPIARDIINGVVAGGVASASGTYFMTNPVWAMILGSASGILQTIGQTII